MSLIIYTKPDCPYCERALEHYRSVGEAFVEYDAQYDIARQNEMLAITGGDPTVPAIVRDGKLIASGWGEPPRGCTIVVKDLKI